VDVLFLHLILFVITDRYINRGVIIAPNSIFFAEWVIHSNSNQRCWLVDSPHPWSTVDVLFLSTILFVITGGYIIGGAGDTSKVEEQGMNNNQRSWL
jgi:hypothetical protein